MGSGFLKKKKQQRGLEERLVKLQEELRKAEHKGSSGNGLVEVVLSGDKSLKKIFLKEECVDPKDVEGLQDLIFAAFKEAEKKLEENSPGFF